MSEIVNNPASTAEISEIIIELEQYRERLVNDILQLGKKIKLSQKAVDKNITQHPEIAKIDLILEQLRSQLSELS
ncbi:acetyltransferase [Geminocystis sp. GBBB08]|uniref:acetyltransferase n=1 Tax=Geminocystis sp. GBBB08 TaxID=2604140 RepID=UPI0027E2BCB0|nr:acetyltransferase [Geminocystis sp. GBBB08]MBL1210057.1 acetyltransferase [Geminocystis sp. GBBB08]